MFIIGLLYASIVMSLAKKKQSLKLFSGSHCHPFKLIKGIYSKILMIWIIYLSTCLKRKLNIE